MQICNSGGASAQGGMGLAPPCYLPYEKKARRRCQVVGRLQRPGSLKARSQVELTGTAVGRSPSARLTAPVEATMRNISPLGRMPLPI